MLLLAALAACAPTTRPTDGSPSAGTAELIAPGVLSTNANEYNPSLSPDGRTLVFARSAADFRTPAILVSRLERGEWSTPRPVPFADPRFGDSDPTFAPDGRTLYFISDRPAPGRDASRRDLDLWRVRFDAGRWGTPEHLGNEVNGPGQELGPAWHDGWLYFGSTRGGQARMLDLFRARDTGEGFGPAEPLPGVNTEASEGDPELSADGSLLLFWSNRPGGTGSGDVYASRRQPEGWSTPFALRMNSAGFDFTPSFSRDGRWLYFGSDRTEPAAGGVSLPAQSNLFRVPAASVLP
jgi:dipeptidyl aminopeptidase/acylaminoacyl peptidase